MGLNRTWTREEELYLAENWGRMTIPGLAKSLRRSTAAIKVRASRLKLGPVLDSGDYITLRQLIVAVTGTRAGYSYKMKSWVENRGLPVHTKRVEKNTFRVVFLDDWWKWAYENRSFIDFSKMEPLALGEEPPWVKEQRAKDFTAFRIQRKDPWTAYDDSRLIALLKKHQYGYAEMSQMLNRSTGAIQRRCQDLGLRERPVRASNRPERPWDDEAYQILADGIRAGDSYAVIGQRIGKSEKAVRGKVYTAYLTEDADKVRAMMGTGPWGGWSSNPDGEAGHISYRPVSGGKKGPGHHRRDTAAEGRCNGLGSVLAAEDVPALGRLQGLRGRLRELRHLHGVQAHRAAVLLPLWARLL